MTRIPWGRKLSLLRRKLCAGRGSDDFLHLYDKGCYAEAFSVFRNTLEENPRCLETGDMYVLWADLELLVNRDAQRALELLDTAIEKGCADMAFYYAKRGAAFETTGQLDRAVQCYRESVAEDPWVYYRLHLARVLSFLEDPEALRLWQQIIDEDPENCVGYAFSAWEMAKAGNQNGAQRMEQIAEGLVGSPIETFWIASLYHRKEDYRNAIKWYLKARDLGYGSAGSLNAAVAACYVSLRDPAAARAHLDCARNEDPEGKYVKDVQEEYERAFGADDY